MLLPLSGSKRINAIAQTRLLLARRTSATTRAIRRASGPFHGDQLQQSQYPRISLELEPKPTEHHFDRHSHAIALSLSSPRFWISKETWKRAAVNTLRCLVGCTAGDFSMMWFLQANVSGLATGTTMCLSSKFSLHFASYRRLINLRLIVVSGIASSMSLETALLRFGRDKLPWKIAFRTAAGMSMISMLAMETAENIVDYGLTGGNIMLCSPEFWVAAGAAMVAGFLTPLPYNYVRLYRYRQSCH